MSIWTFKLGKAVGIFRIPAVLLGLFLPVSACLDTGFDAVSQDRSSALSRVSFYDGNVVVAGPDGYCIDAKSVKRRTASSFALLASCAKLTSGPSQYVDPMVITVSVLRFNADVQHPTARDIAKTMSPAKALKEINDDSVSLVHMAQGGDTVVPGGDPRYWRAGLVINGHLVGLAAYAEKDGTLAGPKGRKFLLDMAKNLRKQSPKLKLVTSPDVTTTPAPATTPSRSKPKGIKAILTGLFPNPV